MEFQIGQEIVWPGVISQGEISGRVLDVSDKYLWVDILTGGEGIGIRRFEIERIEMDQNGKDPVDTKTIRFKTDPIPRKSESKYGSRAGALYQQIVKEKEPNKIKEILQNLFEF